MTLWCCKCINQVVEQSHPLELHLVLTTKYRRKAITPSMLSRLQEIVQNFCQEQGCDMIEFNGEADRGKAWKNKPALFE